MNHIWPLFTALLAGVFTLLLVKQFAQRGKIHQIIWSVGFALFAFAAFAEFFSEVWGWNPGLYRFYYVSAASLVAFLGGGTAFLVFSKKVAWVYLVYAVALTLMMLVSAIQAEIMVSAFVPGKVVAGQAMPDNVRLFSPLLTIPGSFILVFGALYSWLKGRAAYNLAIAAGAMVVAGAGGLARFGWPGALYLGEMFGLILLFYGFVASWSHLKVPVTRMYGRGDWEKY